MNRKVVCILVAFLFISFLAQAAQKKPSPLDIALTTKDINIQRNALHTIAENKDAYQVEVKERIELIAQSKERSPELFILLHIAALIKCETAFPILERLWLRPKTGDDVCIACDPRSLVMTVFAIHQIWSPPPLSSTQSQNTCVMSTLSDLKNLKGIWANPDLNNTYWDRLYNSLDGYGEAARRTRSLDEEELLSLTTNPEASYEIRYIASLALKSRFRDDHLLIDYYWWALNACEDASGECYCDAIEMILRAEDYSVAADIPPSIENSDCYIGGISLGDSYEVIVNMYGAPVNEDKPKSEVAGGGDIDIKYLGIPGGEVINIEYTGMSVHLLDNEAVTIDVTGGPYKMPNGIGIGSEQESVLKLLGKSELKNKDGNIHVFYIIKTPKGGLSDAFLRIEFSDNKVTRIMMIFPYV